MSNFDYPIICSICKAGENFKFIRDFYKEQTKYSLYQCSECYVQFWLPQTVARRKWYEQEGNPYQIRDLVKLKVNRGYHSFFLKRYKNLSKGVRVLDLGCGTGEFLSELEKRGCEVWGLDFDREAIKIAKQRFGLKNIYALSFEEFFKKENLAKFDVITFFEVLEHLNDPLVFIQNLKKLLKPSGKIVLSAPFRERMLPNLNNWDFPPHHFTRWNRESILNLFSKCGFSISYIDYVEEFKILSESISGKFKTGLVGKSLTFTSNKKKSLTIPKIVYFLGRLKDLFLGKIPAVFLWFICKIQKRKNGIIYVEAELIK